MKLSVIVFPISDFWSLIGTQTKSRKTFLSVARGWQVHYHLLAGPVRLSDVPDAPGPGLICDVLPIDWSPEAWAFGCTFLDDEPLLELRTTNHVACGLFCDENDDCTHFAFKPKTNVCRLMSGYVDLDDAARVMFKEGVCGMSPKDEVLWRDGNKALFCLFEGPYYGRPFKANSTECETQCRLSSRCDHFTLNQNVCRLISNAIFEPYQKFTNSKKTLCGHVH